MTAETDPSNPHPETCGIGRRLRFATLIALTLVLPACRTTSALRTTQYWDTRGFPSTNVTGAIAQPTWGTRVFGFTDHGPAPNGPHYLEIQATQVLYHGAGVITEYNREFRNPRGTVRTGFIFQPHLPERFRRDRLQFKATPMSSHEFGTQLGVSATKTFGPNMLVEGYFEYNTKPDKAVSEWQFIRRLKKPISFVTEFRYNGQKRKTTGVAVGLEWTIK